MTFTFATMIQIYRNATVHTPHNMGKMDLLVGAGTVLAMASSSEAKDWGTVGIPSEVIDCSGMHLTPGFIDQHIHITGAGGKYGYGSMTPEVHVTQLIACGTTTVVGLLGTDGTARSLSALYAKCAGLESEGLSAFMLTSYFGLPPKTMTGNVHDDLLFIDRIVGCKIALADTRSSAPSNRELLRILREVQVGGMISSKGGVLHVHLGALPEGMGQLLELVKDHHAPIRRISPTHVGRTEFLFEQSKEFAKLGGIVDLTTGGTRFAEPWEALTSAYREGCDLRQFTLSSDGNAGIGILNEAGELTGFKKAPLDLNLWNVQQLLRAGEVPSELALGTITSGPADNMGLKKKGRIAKGMDADFCLFDAEWNLTGTVARGQVHMWNKEIRTKGNF